MKLQLPFIRRTLLGLGLAFIAASVAPPPASADLSACLRDQNSDPLRRVYITTLFDDYLTDENGCITLPEDPFWGFDYIEVDVHRQNPVVRIDNAAGLPAFITAKTRLREGRTNIVDLSHGSSIDGHMQVAESLRVAYNQGLREFTPWQSEFAGPDTRNGEGLLRVVMPSAFKPGLAWVEAHGLTNGYPAVHFEGDESHGVHAHELGHMLAFSKLTPEKRLESEAGYAAFLVLDEDKFHTADKQTNPMVAWIESFGCFAQLYEETFDDAPAESGPVRHEYYFDEIDDLLAKPDRKCGGTGLDASYRGDDVEGAIMLALFHEFARNPEVGLDLAVETYVNSGALNTAEYGDYMADRFGTSSLVYEALYAAGARYGIAFPAFTGGVLGSVETGDRFGQSSASGDFNGDGYMDLVVGVPDETIAGAVRAGAINVFYGSYFGLMKAKNQQFNSETPGMPGPSTQFSNSSVAGRAALDGNFAEALLAADFDRDGFDDLVIGVPGQNVSGQSRAGYVLVMYGTRLGLTTERVHNFHQNTEGIGDVAEASDLFGKSLAVGDFNGDEHMDLAIGVPYEDVVGSTLVRGIRVTANLANAGAVNVLYGRADGLSNANDQFWTQNSYGMMDSVEAYDYFGWSLAAGNFKGTVVGFNGPSVDDLAVGVPYEDIGSVRDAGAVSLIYGTANRLRHYGNQLWHQNTPGVWGGVEASDRFGFALASGSMNGDVFADLAVGIPFEDIGSLRDAGGVNVFYGGPGLSTSGDYGFSRNSAGIVGVASADDRFGYSLAVANFDGDQVNGRGLDDLAVGVPRDHVGSESNGGSVHVLYGSLTTGISASGDTIFSQNSFGVPDSAEDNDHFGDSVCGGDFNGDGFDELVVGVPQEKRGTATSGGVVHVLRGLPVGLNGYLGEYWHQDR